ncbi:8965_t:CDS:2 [Paraglomus occultum]|uniref:8965_t:CDS:1 n=1 Tax=Paraglomus occultum TaxID=144539 RepID=A0A9N9CJR5_9GLOM|nr:8965_t:CDS:2 [Paraglomus occultum]
MTAQQLCLIGRGYLGLDSLALGHVEVLKTPLLLALLLSISKKSLKCSLAKQFEEGVRKAMNWNIEAIVDKAHGLVPSVDVMNLMPRAFPAFFLLPRQSPFIIKPRFAIHVRDTAEEQLTFLNAKTS